MAPDHDQLETERVGELDDHRVRIDREESRAQRGQRVGEHDRVLSTSDRDHQPGVRPPRRHRLGFGPDQLCADGDRSRHRQSVPHRELTQSLVVEVVVESDLPAVSEAPSTDTTGGAAVL